MKKVGGTRASSSAPREPWRKWLMTLLALGFALLVITLLLKQNKILVKNLEHVTTLLRGQSETSNEYPLQFDLPKGWIMTEGCNMTIGDEKLSNVDCADNVAAIETENQLPVLDREINPEATVVYLQNTDRLPLFGGIGPNAGVEDAYQSNDVALITVTRVMGPDMLSRAQGEVTDLGEGFYKVNICNGEVNGPECGMNGQGADEYYFFGETGTYRMNVKSTWSGGAETIEEIILSAHE